MDKRSSQHGFQSSESVSLRCSGRRNIFALYLWVHQIFFTHFPLTPCKHLVDIRRFHTHNFCNAPDDNQATGDVLRHVTIREIWHEFTVFSCIDWMLESLVGRIGLYGSVKAGVVRDIVWITPHVPLINMDYLTKRKENQWFNCCCERHRIERGPCSVESQSCMVTSTLQGKKERARKERINSILNHALDQLPNW